MSERACDSCRWRCAPQKKRNAPAVGCKSYQREMWRRMSMDSYYEALRTQPAWALECVLLNNADEIERLWLAAHAVIELGASGFDDGAVQRRTALNEAVDGLQWLFDHHPTEMTPEEATR